MHAGLWLDHRRAVIVIVTDHGEEMHEIPSNIDKPAGGENGAGVGERLTQDMRDRKYRTRLNRYYNSIITILRDKEAILIFGPGEAKEELVKRLEIKGLKRHIQGVETVDKMTDRQIAARVREHFKL